MWNESDNNASNASCEGKKAPFVLARPDLVALYIYGYSAVELIGIVANALSFVVLARDKSRTTTRIFLLSLACADCAILITYFFHYTLRTVVELYQLQSLFLLQVNEPYIYAATNLFKFIQIYIILVISADRYFAIHYPLRAPKVCTIRNARIACSVIVVASVLFNVPRLFRYERVAVYNSCFNVTVFQFFPLSVFGETFVTIHSDVADPLMYYFVPLLSLVTLNVLLIRAVKKANAVRERMSSQSKQENNITRTLVAIITTFIVCESPTVVLYGFELCSRLDPGNAVCSSIVYTDETALAASTLLLLINSSINFFLYILIGKKFRRLFLETCCGAASAAHYRGIGNTTTTEFAHSGAKHSTSLICNGNNNNHVNHKNNQNAPVKANAGSRTSALDPKQVSTHAC